MFKKTLPLLLLVLFSALILTFSVRGKMGNPFSRNLLNPAWQESGPFELSPERGRFALTYSILEDRSFQFSKSLAQFAQPDVVVSQGKFASMFAPLLSFIIMPGYLIGKYFGASQVGAFAVISLFAILNLLLVRSIAIKLGAKPLAATLGSLAFLFATPAFSYGVNLYQHHVSTFLILLSIWSLLKLSSFWSLVIVFFCFALAIPLDYPNLFFLFPIAIYAMGKIILFKKTTEKLLVEINFIRILTPVVAIFPILFFLIYNQLSYGNAFQLSGTLPSASDVLMAQNKPLGESSPTSKTAVGFFQTRRLLNGFYLHFVSPDRGVIYFTPVILLGALGAFVSFKKGVKLTTVFIAIVGANVLLYSMWGDPWGGWAFGSRYLIPSYAVLSIFIALLLTFWQKKTWLLLAFLVLFNYSAAINTLGALTTSANPPQVEVLNLEKLSGVIQKYTYERNWDLLLSGNSKSFVFQTFAANYFTALKYFEILLSLIIFAGLFLTARLWFEGWSKK